MDLFCRDAHAWTSAMPGARPRLFLELHLRITEREGRVLVLREARCRLRISGSEGKTQILPLVMMIDLSSLSPLSFAPHQTRDVTLRGHVVPPLCPPSRACALQVSVEFDTEEGLLFTHDIGVLDVVSTW